MEDKNVFIPEYELEEQVEDLVRATGLGKHIIRRILLQQRKCIQSKLKLGYGVNLKGLVKITPKEKGDHIVLTAQVAQAVERPLVIKRVDLTENHETSTVVAHVEDEELE